MSCVTLKFDVWPWKAIGHLFYATSKLCAPGRIHQPIQTGVTVRKHQIWVKICNFWTVWPWNLTDDLEKTDTSSMLLKALCIISQPYVDSNSSYSPETPKGGPNRRFLFPRKLEIWQMTLKNDRASLLCFFKLCASLHCHMWIQTGVKFRKQLNWVLTCDLHLLTSDLDLLHGHHLCQWWLTLKISWWYVDRDIVKKVWQTEGQTDKYS